jgi:hypothetical protein
MIIRRVLRHVSATVGGVAALFSFFASDIERGANLK